MTRFLITNFVLVPDISDAETWRSLQDKRDRDFPWVFADENQVCYSGLGQRWRGWRRRGRHGAHATFRASPFFLLNAGLAWLAHAMDLLRLSRRGPLVAVAPSPESGLGAAVAKLIQKRKLRLVVRIIGHTASKARFVTPSRLRFVFLEAIESFVLRQADLVLPMGTFTHRLATSRGAKKESTIVLPMPVRWAETEGFTELPLQPTVLFVGRLEREKGVAVLVRAMRMVKEKIPRVRLLIAGGGSCRPQLEELSKSLHLERHVSFLGWLKSDELRKTYQGASLLVLPSIVPEGLGMVLVEAGLMGRPVIASSFGGVLDVVRHGENGLLVPPGQVNALADAMVQILGDRDQATLMGLAGMRIARHYLEGRTQAVALVQQAFDELGRDGTP